MSKGVEENSEERLIEEVKKGSVIVRIYHAPTKIKVAVAAGDGSGELAEQLKTYESFSIIHYEGSLRVQRRRSTLAKAKTYAKEVADRLSREGARAVFMTERDRRVYVLAQAAVKSLGLEVDEACRRLAELHTRVKNGTPEQAVDFFNDHGQRLRLGIECGKVYEEYIQDLEKRGIGKYYLRDVKRYVGGFVEKYRDRISAIQTTDIDSYLAGRGGRSRSKNNFRDAIIAFFTFAQDKGFLPYNLPHAALATTEFGDPRQEITSEAQAIELLQPNDIYSPDEMRKLLAADTKQVLRATMEIKAFSGVRTEEIVRLWWVMLAENEDCIRVPDAVGKIDARQIPLLPNLKKRLAAYSAEMKRGRVAAKWTLANSVYHAWKRACKKAGVPYRRNAFRNSYFTYRLAIVGDPEQVAAEGGTSVAMLKKNYLSKAPVSRATAEEWFAL